MNTTISENIEVSPLAGRLPAAADARDHLAHARSAGQGLLDRVAGTLSLLGGPARRLAPLAVAAALGGALVDEANAGFIVDKAADPSASPRFGSTALALGGREIVAGTTFENPYGPSFLNRFSFDVVLRDGVADAFVENWGLGDLGGDIHLMVRNSLGPIPDESPASWLSNTNVTPYATIERVNDLVNRVHITLPDDTFRIPDGEVTIAFTTFNNLGAQRNFMGLTSTRPFDPALTPDLRAVFIDGFEESGFLRDFNAQRREYWSASLEFSSRAVPEPSALLLIATGAAAVAGGRALRRLL